MNMINPTAPVPTTSETRTRAEQVLIIEGQKLVDTLLAMTDDGDFVRFTGNLYSYFDVDSKDLGQIAGILPDHITWKRRAGGVVLAKELGNEPVQEFLEQTAPYIGKALNKTDHGDPDADPDWHDWWLENCPDAFRVHVLEQALNTPDIITDLYLDLLGRLPKPLGHDHYTAERKTRPLWEIVREIELSEEANKR